MCLIALAWQAHPEFPLVLVANRDEYFHRPTGVAHWWSAPAPMLAGRDLQAGGTWLGVTAEGRFAALTNYRDPTQNADGRSSRGELVVEALTHPAPSSWREGLAERSAQYNPFNLLVGSSDALHVFESTTRQLTRVSPGVHGLSNHLFNTPWPKLVQARAALTDALPRFSSPRDLIALLRDDHPSPDDALPATGVPLEWERALSSCFIKAPGYGTRSTSVIAIDRTGHCEFIEQTWDEHGAPAGRVEQRFKTNEAS